MFAGQITAGQAIHKSGRIERQQTADAMDERRPLEAVLQEASGCKVCIERKDVWEQCLTTNGHGCSACKKVFEAKTWNAKMVKRHRLFDRDLVCSDCAERGYASGKYDEYQCEECFEILGSLKFDRRSKYKKKRRKNFRLVCQECLRVTRCSSCNTKYEAKYWTKPEQKNHASCLQTKLLCKACRAQGFNPWNLKAYRCQACAYKFGANRFNKRKLYNFNSKRTRKLLCLHCEGSVSSCKEEEIGNARRATAP